MGGGRARGGRAPEPRLDALSRALVAPLSRRRAFGVVAGGARGAGDPDAAGRGRGGAHRRTTRRRRRSARSRPGISSAFVCVPPTSTSYRPLRGGVQHVMGDRANGGSATAACRSTRRACASTRQRRGRAGPLPVLLDHRHDPAGTETRAAIPTDVRPCCPPGPRMRNSLGECRCPSTTCTGAAVPKHHAPRDGNECKKWCDEAHAELDVAATDRRRPGRAAAAACSRDASVSRRSRSVGPAAAAQGHDQGPNWLQQIVDGWRSVMQGSSANHGGGQPAHAARPRAGPAGAAGALDVLAAVTAQRTAAYAAFTDGHRDERVGSAVKVGKVSLPAVQSGAGIDAGSAKALNAVLAVAGEGVGTDHGRRDGAGALAGGGQAPQPLAARRQLLASARFADQAASSLGKVGGLRSKVAAAMEGRPGDRRCSSRLPTRLRRCSAACAPAGLPTQIAALLAGLDQGPRPGPRACRYHRCAGARRPARGAGRRCPILRQRTDQGHGATSSASCAPTPAARAAASWSRATEHCHEEGMGRAPKTPIQAVGAYNACARVHACHHGRRFDRGGGVRWAAVTSSRSPASSTPRSSSSCSSTTLGLVSRMGRRDAPAGARAVGARRPRRCGDGACCADDAEPHVPRAAGPRPGVSPPSPARCGPADDAQAMSEEELAVVIAWELEAERAMAFDARPMAGRDGSPAPDDLF